MVYQSKWLRKWKRKRKVVHENDTVLVVKSIPCHTPQMQKNPESFLRFQTMNRFPFFFFFGCVCVFLGHPKKKEKTSSFGLVFQENVRVFEKPSKGNERRNGKTCFLRFLGFLLFGFLKLQRCERERERKRGLFVWLGFCSADTC